MYDYTCIINKKPRLPAEISIDLTYRCNNNCRHCWTRIPSNYNESEKELSISEIKTIIIELRKMGSRRWNISGGEPMIRSDFYDVLDFVTKMSLSCSVNTNGTFITPSIARLFKKRGTMAIVAIYGATSEIHDLITRNMGSFKATIQGISYLSEEKANFVIQIVPMTYNFHQRTRMIEIANSYNARWRWGAEWIWLSAFKDPKRNAEIQRQRLPPRNSIELESPPLGPENYGKNTSISDNPNCDINDRLLFNCASEMRGFYIDPYGQASICGYLRNSPLLYGLRGGSVSECWERFIPSLAEKVEGGDEYKKNCGICDMRPYCRWCPAYAYLEHGRFSAKIQYLCDLALEKKKYIEGA